MRATLQNPEPFASALYTAHILTAFQDIYGDIFQDPKDVFNSKYTLLPDIIRKQIAIPVADTLPENPSQLVNQKFLMAMLADAPNRFRQHLMENDVYNWAPKAPTLLVYSQLDKVVSPENAAVAFARMKALGGNVEILMAGEKLTHTTGVAASYLLGRSFLKKVLGIQPN